MAAQAGQSTLIVEVEGKSGIGAVFGRREVLGYEEEQLAERVKARTLTPDDALLEYLADHGMKRISKRLTQSGALDVVSTAVPGIKDILVLG
jgi:anion-transporting  ArsA/GET3 family ATPase